MDMKIWTARGLTVVSITIWAMCFIWGKQVLAWANPLWAAVIRYAIASMVLLVLALRSGGLYTVLKENWRRLLVLGALGVAANQVLSFSALRYSSPTNVAVIMALTPLITMAGAALFFQQPFGLRAGVGAVISFVGATLAVLGDGPHGLAGLTLDHGEPLALLGAACLAFYTIGTRHLVPSRMPVIEGTAVTITIAMLVMSPLALLEPVPRGLPPADILIAFAGLSIGGTVFGFLVLMYSTRILGVGEAGLYFNFVPVVTLALAALQGSWPWPAQIVGALLVVAGVFLAISRASSQTALPREGVDPARRAA